MCCRECLLPFVPCLWACGFREGGVLFSSCASCTQASIGNVAANSPFALAQSVGATSPCCCKILCLLLWIGVGLLILYCFGITPTVIIVFLKSVGATLVTVLNNLWLQVEDIPSVVGGFFTSIGATVASWWDNLWLSVEGFFDGSESTTGNGTSLGNTTTESTLVLNASSTAAYF